MRVKWTQQVRGQFAESIMEMFPNANLCDFDKDYTGEVIGVTRGILSGAMLTVACDDGRIREVNIDNAVVITE